MLRITVGGPDCGTDLKAQAKALSHMKGQFLHLFLSPTSFGCLKWANLEKTNSAESGHGLGLKFNPLPGQSELIKRTIYGVRDLKRNHPNVCSRPTTTTTLDIPAGLGVNMSEADMKDKIPL